MKKSDKKTETKSEEVKPVEEVTPAEEIKAEETAPEKQPVEEAKPEEVAPAEEPKAEEAAPAEEQTPETKNDKKSFFSSKRNIGIVACAGAAVIALSLGLGLGLGLKHDEEPPAKKEFSAPTGVDIPEGSSIISWTAVDNATNGYTLKFEESNKELTLKVVSYNLLSDTSYLADGVNSLYVKVNATETYLESKYSAKVTYNYVPERPEKTPFEKPVATLAADEKTLEWQAVTGATNGYTVKIGDTEKTVNGTSVDLSTLVDTSVTATYQVSVKVNATDDHKESEYSDAVSFTYTHENPAFDVPANVDLDGDTLIWDAVTGATNGYTVKIGSQTVTVNTNSLDLKTVTAKLVSGVNKLSVKVNATDDHQESEYSAEIDYTYTPSAEEEAADYVALVEAIGSITADSTGAQADAVAAAISTAANKYNGLSAEAKELDEVIAAKESFDTKKLAFDTVYDKAEDDYYAFIDALDEANAEAAKEEDYVALTEKVTAVNTANGALSTLAKSMITEEDATAYNAVKQTLTEWSTAIDEAKAIWQNVTSASFNAIVGTDAQKLEKAEENITTADGLIAQYSDKKYVQNAVIEGTTKISDKKAIADGALTAAKTAIENIVNPIKTTVSAFTGTIASENVNEEYLAELNAMKELVDGFGVYASTLWTAELTTKLTDEIAALEKAIDIADALAEIQEADAALSGKDDEEIIASVNAFEEDTYANYADYIKENASIISAYGTYTAKRTTAKNNIESTVDDIVAAAETAIEENTEPNEENYAALEAQKTAIEEVTGAYATEYLSTLKIGEAGVLEAVKNAMETMLATVVYADDEFGEAHTLYADALKVSLMKAFYNFRGEKIAATEDLIPELTVSGEGVTLEQNFVLSDLNEYVAIIVVNLNTLGNDASYTVKGSQPTPLKFGSTIGYNPYFTNDNEIIDGEATGFKKAVVGGNFVMTFQADCTAEHYYLEVYNANAVTADGAFAKFSEKSLGKVDVTSIKNSGKTLTTDEFNRFLLNSDLESLFLNKSLNVRFKIYGTTVANGTPAFTEMSTSVVSEAIPFNLTEEDKKIAISTFNNTVFDLGVYNNGILSLVATDNIKYGEVNGDGEYVKAFLDQFDDQNITAANVQNYLQIKVSAYKESDDSLLFSTTAPFKNQGYDYNSFIREWARYRLENDIEDYTTVKFYLTLSIIPIKDSDLDEIFRESERVNVNKQGPYTGTHTFKVGDDKTAIEPVAGLVHTGISDDGVFTLITEANISDDFAAQFGNSDITKDNVKDYLQIRISAYAEDDTEGENELFYVLAPFKAGGYDYNTFIRNWARYRLNNNIALGEVRFYLTQCIQPNDTVLESNFRNSERVNIQKNALYTGTHTFKKDDDKKSINLPNALVHTGISNEGVFTLITEAIISDDFAAQFGNSDITKDNVKDYLQIRISVYATDDTEGENELFYVIAPFKAGGYNYNTFIKDWTVNRYPDGVQNDTVNFYFTYTVQLKEEVNNTANPLTSDFKDSERIKVDEPSGVYTGTHTFGYVEIAIHNMIDAGVGNGKFGLVTAYNGDNADIVRNYDNFIGQFNNVIDGLTITRDNIKDYLQIKVTAYANNDTNNENELFSAIAPFENLGYNYNEFISSWSVYHYYHNSGNVNETVYFKLTLTIQLKEEVDGATNPFSKYFKDSASTAVRQENDFTGSYEFKESDVKLPDTIQLNKTNEPILFQGFDVANDIINGYITHMEIHFAKVENATDPVNPSTYETAYVYYYKNDAGDDTFVVYRNPDKSDEGLVFNKGGNEYWRSLGEVNNWFKSYDSDFDLTGEGWYFRTQLIDNTDDNRYIVGDGLSGWTTFYTPAD